MIAVLGNTYHLAGTRPACFPLPFSEPNMSQAKGPRFPEALGCFENFQHSSMFSMQN